MNIIFFGTGDVAVPTFTRLLASAHQITLCVTTPDRPQGRGLHIVPSPVKTVAQEHRVPVCEVKRFAPAVVREIATVRPEVGVVVDFGRIIPAEIIAIPTMGLIGMHPSLLPKYRGPSPVAGAMLAGEGVTGITVFRIADEVDSGDVLLQDTMTIYLEETAVSLQRRLAEHGANHIIHGLQLMQAGDVHWRPQNHAEATLTRKFKKPDGRIDWSLPAGSIVNQIRALQPWPGTHTTWEAKSLKITQAKEVIDATTAPPGTIFRLTGDGFVVAAGKMAVLVTMLQLEGKREMLATEFCRGNPISEGQQLGAD